MGDDDEPRTDTPDGPLFEASERLLKAASDYYKAFTAAGLHGAVVWVQDTDGKTVILTRGEYRGQLMENIHKLPAGASRLEWEHGTGPQPG